MKKFYDVHVFYSRKYGFSVFIDIDTENELSDEEVIMTALVRGLISNEDVGQVDYVVEIDEDEYKTAKGI